MSYFLPLLVIGLFTVHSLIQIDKGRRDLQAQKGSKLGNYVLILLSVPILLLALLLMIIVASYNFLAT